MNIRTSRFPLQHFIHALPKPLQRNRIAQLFASITGSPYHRVVFQQGELVGNVRDGAVANSLVRGTFADYGYFDLAHRLLAAGEVHVDLGANYGFHTFGLLQSPISSTIRYLLIDANPDCIACLSESARLHPALQIQILHVAAAVVAGDISFTFSASMTGSGHVGKADNSGGIEITVPALPLDDLFEENGVQDIGLLKMDIEGSEPFAMQSLSRMLSSHRVNFVYFEVNPGCLKLLQTDPVALFNEFNRHGYRLFWPHDDVNWILDTYGRSNAAESDLERFTIWGSEPHSVIGFDQTRYRPGLFGQCDLLAVSPRCLVDVQRSTRR